MITNLRYKLRDNHESNLKKIQFQLLILDIKSNIFMSNDTFNKLRKKSKTKQGLRTHFQRLYSQSCSKGSGWAIWHLTSPGLQIFAGRSTNWTPCAYFRFDHTNDNKNSQKYCYKAPNLRTQRQSDDWRNCKLRCLSLPCQRGLSWLIVPGKIMKFAWNTFLIVTWKQNLGRAMILLSQLRVALLDSLVH